MNIKKIKRRCEVRGCRNKVDAYLIAKTREVWNTPCICKECLKDALSSIEALEKAKNEADVTISSVADNEPEPNEVIVDVTEESPISVTEDTVTTKAEVKPKTTASAKKKPTKKK